MELLLVIGIIGLLAAISVPVVMQSLAKARNAAIKAEIDMLHMAIMNYKNQYGSFPPCDSLVTIDGSSDAASIHLQRVFPQIKRLSASDRLMQARSLPFSNSEVRFPYANRVTPDTALLAWLRGYNGRPDYPVLFTPNTSPAYSASDIVITGTAMPRKALFDFDRSRISSYRYFPPQIPTSFYLYIDRSRYGNIGPGETIPSFIIDGNTYGACRRPASSVSPSFGDPTQVPFNENTFQILSAGRDGEWGTDDDLSNFWPGTRREYLDSLK